MKHLQVLILGFLNNSEFFHLKNKKKINTFINMYVSVAIAGFSI